MPKTRKTREEKIKSAYRLANFRLNVEAVKEKKDANEFGYLSREYVKKDLIKTVIYSGVIVVLLALAKRYLG